MDNRNDSLEAYVVGCMIQDSNCSNRCLEINEKYFKNESVRNIYNTIVKLLDENKVVDMAELAIRKVNIKTLQSCLNIAVTTASFDYKLEKLKALYNKENVIMQIEKLRESLKEQDFETVDELNTKLIDVINIEKNNSNKAKSLLNIYCDLYVEFDDAKKRKPMFYGMKYLDECTQGVFNNELTVIAARPGKGKTALSIQFCINLSEQGFKGVFFSREMGETQVIRRIIANKLKINSNKLKRYDNLNEQEKIELMQKSKLITDLPLRIDTKSSTIEQIKIITKYYKQRNELDFIVIDYLQLLRTDKKFQSREQEISYYSRELRLLSQELDIPIFLLAQLNRAVEQRQNQRPMLSDLRESGAIEQDANNVFMLYQDEDMEKNKFLDIMIVKQREGILRNITVKYYKSTNIIVDK